MPVTPQYEWDETSCQVNVRVTLSGLTKQKPDVFATDALVKVVAHPYLLLLDLAADVVSERSSAVVNNCVITFTLCKVRTARTTARQRVSHCRLLCLSRCLGLWAC